MVSNNTPMNNKQQTMTSLKDSAKYIAGAILLALVGFFGWNYYQNKTTTVDTAAADSYIDIQQRMIELEAAAQNPNLDDEVKLKLESDLTALNADMDQLIENHGNSIYAWQVLMLQGRQLADKGEYTEAANAYKRSMTIDLQDAGLKAISQLRYASALLGAEDVDGALLAASVEVPMAFEATKQELLGDIYSEQEDVEKAQRAYNNAWAMLQKRQEERAILKLKMEKMGMTPEPIVPKPSVLSIPAADQEQARLALQQEAMNLQSDTDTPDTNDGDEADDVNPDQANIDEANIDQASSEEENPVSGE